MGMRMNKSRHTSISTQSQQSGFALIVGLIVLLLLTLIMLVALRMASLEERMAGNLKNQNIAFQAAESALREAEARIRNGTDGLDEDEDGVPDTNAFNPLRLSDGPFQNTTAPLCVDGLCGTSDPLQSALIGDLHPSVMRKANLALPAPNIETGLLPEPQYIIELITVAPHTDPRLVKATFRVTARARGEDPNSLVQLQSTYRADVPFDR